VFEFAKGGAETARGMLEVVVERATPPERRIRQVVLAFFERDVAAFRDPDVFSARPGKIAKRGRHFFRVFRKNCFAS